MKLQNEPDHIHVPQTVSVPALFTVDGMEYTVCVDCGETIGDTVVIPAIGHNPRGWKTVVEHAVNSERTKVKICTECGMIIEEAAIPKLAVITHTETGISIVYTGSNYDGVLKVVVEESFDRNTHTVKPTIFIAKATRIKSLSLSFYHIVAPDCFFYNIVISLAFPLSPRFVTYCIVHRRAVCFQKQSADVLQAQP